MNTKALEKSGWFYNGTSWRKPGTEIYYRSLNLVLNEFVEENLIKSLSKCSDSFSDEELLFGLGWRRSINGWKNSEGKQFHRTMDAVVHEWLENLSNREDLKSIITLLDYGFFYSSGYWKHPKIYLGKLTTAGAMLLLVRKIHKDKSFKSFKKLVPIYMKGRSSLTGKVRKNVIS